MTNPSRIPGEVLTPFSSHECQLALIDFTLSNARRFYSSMGNPLELKGLRV